MLLPDGAARRALGNQRADDRAEGDGKCGEVSKHQLEHAPVEPPEVRPELLSHVEHVRGHMSDGHPELNELHP